MQAPTVTFLVPCYRLAHLLAECVESIISQSYANLEVIILDDQSPDDTAEVSRGIITANGWARISYILNDRNLGNIRNYNKGIGLAQGTYVWILSPDDRLRSKHIVDKYVRLMEANSGVGYVFCPAHIIQDDQDVGLLQDSRYGTEDQILDSVQLIKDYLDGRVSLVAASVMIRKKCYEHITLFPEDMPHRGDTYVWSAIAMRYRVGYFSEAMVDYRIHSESMMSRLSRENMMIMLEDDIAIPWRVKVMAEELNIREIATHCENAIILTYKRALLGATYRGRSCSFTLNNFESSLLEWESNSTIRRQIRIALGRHLYWFGMAELCRGHLNNAHQFLHSSFKLHPKLRYCPPLGQLMKTPDLSKRVVSILGMGAARLFGRASKILRGNKVML
jgi:glycosyltransferase involved in cell wall biosynthesis